MPDKSMSIRAVLFNAYATGKATVRNLLLSDDVLSAVDCGALYLDVQYIARRARQHYGYRIARVLLIRQRLFAFLSAVDCARRLGASVELDGNTAHITGAPFGSCALSSFFITSSSIPASTPSMRRRNAA